MASETHTKGKALYTALTVISIPFFLVVWHLLSVYLGEYRLPSPLRIVKEFVPTLFDSAKLAMAGGGYAGFWPHVVSTFLKVVIGFVIGIPIGVCTGLAMKWFKTLNHLLTLPLDILRTLPPLAFVPLVFMFLGRAVAAQMALIALYSFLTVVINTLNAVDNVSPVVQKFALTLGASRGQLFRTVILPAIIPELVGAVRVGLIWAWGYQVVLEMMGSQMGVGKVFFLTKSLNALDLVVIGVVWMIILAGAMDAVILVLSRFITRWQPRIKRELVEY